MNAASEFVLRGDRSRGNPDPWQKPGDGECHCAGPDANRRRITIENSGRHHERRSPNGQIRRGSVRAFERLDLSDSGIELTWAVPSYATKCNVCITPCQVERARRDLFCEDTANVRRAGPAHPSRRHGRVLRVGGAARRPVAAREAGRRRRQSGEPRRRRGRQL